VNPADGWAITLVIVGSVALAVLLTIREVDRYLERRRFRRRNHAYPMDWDR